MRWFVLMMAFAVSVTVLGGGAAIGEEAKNEDLTHVDPFEEGDIVTFDSIDQLRDYLPPPFWKHRDFFFFEGMEMEIGPPFRESGASDAYRRVTNENRGKASIDPDGSLAGYTGGLPFPSDEIDCRVDPDAATKIIWNFEKAWNGDGSMSHFNCTYWDKKEKLPILYAGTSKNVNPKNRIRPDVCPVSEVHSLPHIRGHATLPPSTNAIPCHTMT